MIFRDDYRIYHIIYIQSQVLKLAFVFAILLVLTKDNKCKPVMNS
jgi:hypothetical protein